MRDLDTYLPVMTLVGHTGSVRGRAVTSDGLRLISASIDRPLKMTQACTPPPAISIASVMPGSVRTVLRRLGHRDRDDAPPAEPAADRPEQRGPFLK